MTVWGVVFPAWVTAGTVAAALSLPGTIELAVLTIGGILRPRRAKVSTDSSRWRVIVVVPAHNEEAGIADCVRSLLRCATPNMDAQIVVVADNCTDRTAEVATIAGARILIRHNLDLRGKGFALDYAFSTFIHENVDAFLVVDADSYAEESFLTKTVAMLRSGADAVQCRYLVGNPTVSIRMRLLSVANRGFNVLRPRGRDRWGLSCLLYGNGFGMRRETLLDVPYSAGSVVEDLEYHLLLVKAGKTVRFVDDTAVYGEMPEGGRGAETQRTRWEGGRFRMMRDHVPALSASVLKGQISLLEPLLDLLLLPLVFHVVLLLIAASSPWAPAQRLGLTGLAIVAFHLLAAIFATGGGMSDLLALCAAPFYIVWKVLLIPKLIKGSLAGTTWVRTERAAEQKRP